MRPNVLLVILLIMHQGNISPEMCSYNYLSEVNILIDAKINISGTICYTIKYLNYTKYNVRGYSSVVEHSTADREVAGSNPAVPF